MEQILYLMQVLKLAGGILAIQDPSFPVEPRVAYGYADAAFAASKHYGVNPWELIGLARNETGFRANLRGPDLKDCGITQTRITWSRYTCRQLRKSYRLGFHEGARELSEYARPCRKRGDYDRCRLNRYNSGVRYARSGWHGRYWLRVLCFAESARRGVTGEGCLAVTSRSALNRIVSRAKVAAVPALTSDLTSQTLASR